MAIWIDVNLEVTGVFGNWAVQFYLLFGKQRHDNLASFPTGVGDRFLAGRIHPTHGDFLRQWCSVCPADAANAPATTGVRGTHAEIHSPLPIHIELVDVAIGVVVAIDRERVMLAVVLLRCIRLRCMAAAQPREHEHGPGCKLQHRRSALTPRLAVRHVIPCSIVSMACTKVVVLSRTLASSNRHAGCSLKPAPRLSAIMQYSACCSALSSPHSRALCICSLTKLWRCALGTSCNFCAACSRSSASTVSGSAASNSADSCAGAKRQGVFHTPASDSGSQVMRCSFSCRSKYHH